MLAFGLVHREGKFAKLFALRFFPCNGLCRRTIDHWEKYVLERVVQLLVCVVQAYYGRIQEHACCAVCRGRFYLIPNFEAFPANFQVKNSGEFFCGYKSAEKHVAMRGSNAVSAWHLMWRI